MVSRLAACIGASPRRRDVCSDVFDASTGTTRVLPLSFDDADQTTENVHHARTPYKNIYFDVCRSCNTVLKRVHRLMTSFILFTPTLYRRPTTPIDDVIIVMHVRSWSYSLPVPVHNYFLPVYFTDDQLFTSKHSERSMHPASHDIVCYALYPMFTGLSISLNAVTKKAGMCSVEKGNHSTHVHAHVMIKLHEYVTGWQ